MTTTKNIHLSPTDHQKLSGILKSMKAKGNLKALHLKTLMAELSEAVIVPEGHIPEHIVGMGSTVEYFNPLSKTTEKARLVFPVEADAEKRNISVLAPLGAALIGESAGTKVQCQAPDTTWVVEIISVTHQTEN
ncbi:GreA/GreB family elongation factor [Alkalispirochaeta alkalica]|uniref:GreA/GreB family elongation factor n=1 Tax=Alkalispirochaeta alkalica TaxID=46356 RepID=UPI0003649ACF|nr:GreA/GreB family elongation factor [Alkalispirochaeta alkalica]